MHIPISNNYIMFYWWQYKILMACLDGREKEMEWSEVE